MDSKYEIIIDFAPIKDADNKWKEWLSMHDVSNLGEND